MNKRFRAIAILVAAVAAAAAAGLLASPSNSAANHATSRYCGPPAGCGVALTADGPAPSTLEMQAAGGMVFVNRDSVPHTVVFAKGDCSITLTPGEQGGPDGRTGCSQDFPYYVGSYPYTVDGTFPGTLVTTPISRSVTLTARRNRIRAGTGLRLHGQVVRPNNANVVIPVPFSVIVLARHDRNQPFEPIATARAKFLRTNGIHGPDTGTVTYAWKLKVQPAATTTYIAKVTSQRLCWKPVSRCAHPHGQVFTNPTSRRFTVQVRH